MSTTQSLLLACCTLALLTFAVSVRMYLMRVREMKARRIHPQSVALSAERSARLQDTRASDNYNHLFELPVLFYALAALALATGTVPGWLAIGGWLFVATRMVHSIIQCTYNRVMHRFAVFMLGLAVLAVLWVAFTWRVLLG